MTKMNFFDDDSGTFDGHPMKRFFRMRKWFFATALSVLLVDSGWLDYEKLTTFLALPNLPKAVIHTALTYTGLYLIVQSTLVGSQIVATYPQSMRLRQSMVFGGMIEKLQDQIAEAEDQDHRNELATRLNELKHASVTVRLTIMITETVLDAIRVLPTYIFLLYIVIRHGTLGW